MSGITRREALASMAAGIAAAGCATSGTVQSAQRPNLLFILSDDHRYDALGCMGNNVIQTPVLDGMAAEGTLFTHCFVSNPICTPSRACVLTGQYGGTNDVTFFSIPINPASPQIGRVLAAAGYAVGYTGKWHNDQRPVHHGFTHMKDVFLGGMSNHDAIKVVQGVDDKPVVKEVNDTELFTEAALALMAEMPEPWCLFVCYTVPHDPRMPRAEYEAMYPVEHVELPKNFMREPKFDPGTLDIRDEKLHPRPFDVDLLKNQTAKYYGHITHMDAQIGRLRRHLEGTGQWDQTVTVFGGDNGLTLGSHGLLGKQTLYEEGVRVPLIVRGPGVAAQKSDALVDLMDVMPSLCEFAGAPVPAAVEAQSFLPIAAGKQAAVRKEIYCEYDDLLRSVRTDRYKLVLHLASTREGQKGQEIAGKEELFDLVADPYELTDRVDDPALAGVKQELRGRLQAWMERWT